MTNVSKLPTAAKSYFTVRNAGLHYNVVLVTPCPGKNLHTVLCRFGDREDAVLYAKERASEMHRPFKMKGGAS